MVLVSLICHARHPFLPYVAFLWMFYAWAEHQPGFAHCYTREQVELGLN